MANRKFDMNQSLSQLDKSLAPNGDASSYLIKRHNELLTKKIMDFSIEDFRLMIGQNTGLQYLIPVAINHLRQNILAEGDYYEGDLLKSVLTSDKNFWLKHGSLCRELIEVIENQLEYLLDYPIDDKAKVELIEAYQEFKEANHVESFI
jgi:hypothetical protein